MIIFYESEGSTDAFEVTSYSYRWLDNHKLYITGYYKGAEVCDLLITSPNNHVCVVDNGNIVRKYSVMEGAIV